MRLHVFFSLVLQNAACYRISVSKTLMKVTLGRTTSSTFRVMLRTQKFLFIQRHMKTKTPFILKLKFSNKQRNLSILNWSTSAIFFLLLFSHYYKFLKNKLFFSFHHYFTSSQVKQEFKRNIQNSKKHKRTRFFLRINDEKSISIRHLLLLSQSINILLLYFGLHVNFFYTSLFEWNEKVLMYLQKKSDKWEFMVWCVCVLISQNKFTKLQFWSCIRVPFQLCDIHLNIRNKENTWVGVSSKLQHPNIFNQN